MPVTPADYVAAIDAALAICEARLAACDAATGGPWETGEAGGPYCNEVWSGQPGPDRVFPVLDCTAPDARFIAAARTDQPAALRRDIAGLQAHRAREAFEAQCRSIDGEVLPDIATHRAYSQRIFDALGVKVAAEGGTC